MKTTNVKKWLPTALSFALILLLPQVMPDSYWLRIYSMCGIYVMLALGLNVVAGFAGLLDLSYVAFFGIGGYLFALFSSSHLDIHLPFILALPLSAVVSMMFGFLLGSTSIRLKGDYLAIVTLSFAQIFKLLLLNLDRPVNITGGVNGIYSLDVIDIFGFRIMSPQAYSYMIWTTALVILFASYRLKDSRLGRGWQSIREDELAAEATGIDTTWMKLLAFAIGALIAGGTGALFASFQDSVFPNNFDFQQLVLVYCMVIIGGMGNVTGVLIGAVLLTILPEVLREYGSYRMMCYGAILVCIMALRPQGLLSDIPLGRKEKRPDRDTTGKLKASTDLYYKDDNSEDQTARYKKESQVVLELSGITRSFGGLLAVDNLDIRLHEKEILSIIGPNGAGKTTLFNLISGIYPPSSGVIRLKEKDITGFRPYKVVKAGIARTFQNLRLFSNMSVLDNARAGFFVRTKTGPFSIFFSLPEYRREEMETRKQAENILSRFGARLSGYRLDQEVRSLSYANRRRVEIARAMATGAKILLLDEPSAGMNPQETEEITHFIRELRDRHGYTILLIEHKLNLVRTISDRVIALDYGKKIAEGTFEEVASDSQVIEAYLGTSR
ncbi:branched-chain amino acid ABC transporter ATP-binding protein/permease [Desulfococcaceae bacterium HSG8]|nr:branched-chain amino acid ABC transporter ATP-binding protein/permease [Desulfococcaceae bacterium HSG8]